MKIVIIGGTGLIASKLVSALTRRGHEAFAAAPNTGVNTMTGEGLAKALAGAEAVVDVTCSPPFEDKAMLEFFETSGRNLLAAEKASSVRHHIALSVVGTERLQGSGYFRGKAIQEKLIKASRVPYTIVRATQFYEFMGCIAWSAAKGEAIHLPTALMQPIASDDVVAALADVSLSAALGGTVEVAGPEKFRMSDIVQRYLKEMNDPHTVVADPKALYFGVKLNDESLLPFKSARIGAIRFESWLGQQRKPRAPLLTG